MLLQPHLGSVSYLCACMFTITVVRILRNAIPELENDCLKKKLILIRWLQLTFLPNHAWFNCLSQPNMHTCVYISTSIEKRAINLLVVYILKPTSQSLYRVLSQTCD